MVCQGGILLEIFLHSKKERNCCSSRLFIYFCNSPMVNSFDILLLDANDKKSKEIEKIISTRSEKEPSYI